MLSSPRASQSSSSRHWTHSRASRSNTMNATHASISRLSISPPPQSSSVPSRTSSSSVFYQVLTAPYRPHALPVCRFGSQSAGINTTASALPERQLYIPHGRWAWAEGLSIDDTEELMQLECTYLSTFYGYLVYIFLP